jgi:hypothetical protein
MSDTTRDNRMVKMAELWERTSAKGTRYFSGFMGDCQVLMFDGGEKDHPTRPGETVHVWRLMLQERDPSRRPQQRDQASKRDLPTRGQSTWDATRDHHRERHATRSRAAAAGAAILEHAPGPQAEPSEGRPFDDWEDARRDLEGRS